MRSLARGTTLVMVLVMAAAGCDDEGPPVPAALESIDDEAITAAVGSTRAVAVRVTNARARPVRDVVVTWSVVAGGGTVDPQGVETDGAGEASAVWTFGTALGEAMLTATVEGVAPLTFTAAMHAGPPASLTPHDGSPVSAPVGSAVLPAPTVVVQDAYGNPVAGAIVLFEALGGAGSVTGAQQTTGADGRARVGSWTLDAVGPQRLSASVVLVESVMFTGYGTSESFDIAVQSVHLNQGNQTVDGSIGGVSDRPGLLRVVVRATVANTWAPDVRVRLYQGATLIRERTVPAGSGSGVPTSPALAVRADTWNVLLPAADMVPGLSVEVVVDPDDLITVRTPGNKRFPREAGTAGLDVAMLHPLRIVFIPVHATAVGRTGSITQATVPAFLMDTRKWIPSGSIEASIAGVYTTSVDLGNGNNWSMLLSELHAKRTLEGARDEYYHGIVPDFVGTPWAGMAYVPPSPGSSFRTGMTYDRMPGAPQTLAHELGHNLGRWHTPCGNPSGVDPGYPHPQAAIGPPGVDIDTGGLVVDANIRDYMSYCTPRWTSDYTYDAILAWRRADPLAVPAAAATTGGVLVWGRVHAGGAELYPSFALDALPVLPDAPGRNTLRGTDTEGRELFGFSFEGVPIADGPDPAEQHFAFFVPLGIDEAAALATIELVAPAGVATRTSAHAATPSAAAMPAGPIAQVERLAGERVRVRWDADRFPMAMVRDPATGEVLAFSRDGEGVLRAGPLAAERVEVIVSDGVRSRVAERDR